MNCLMKRRFLAFAVGVFAVISLNAQTKLRTVDKYAPMRDEPVTIVNTAIGTKSLDASKKAEGNKGWLKELSFEVKNSSNKNIEFIEIKILAEPQAKMDFYMSIVATYGPRLSPRELGKPDYLTRADEKLFRPGQTIFLKPSESDVERFNKDLLKNGIEDLDRVRVLLSWIRFDDGTAWANGATFVHDKDHPGSWDVRRNNAPTKSLDFQSENLIESLV